jgi:cell division protein FtsB
MVTLNQEKRRKIFYRIYFVVACLLLIFFAWGLAKEAVNRQRINKQITDYEVKIAKLQQENGGIKEKMASWQDSSDLETTARTKLGLQRPGEKAIFINRGEPDVGQPLIAIKTNQEIVNLSEEKGLRNQKVSNPIRWWRRFFK